MRNVWIVTFVVVGLIMFCVGLAMEVESGTVNGKDISDAVLYPVNKVLEMNQ